MSLLTASLLFAACAAIVWMSGARLAYLADALADRLKLAKSIVGLLALSTATSLPEISTTLSAAVKQSQDLVLNNLFGGIALQTMILAMADFWARGPITNYPRKANHAVEATLLNLMLGVTMVLLLLGEPWSYASIGLGSVFVACVYCGVIWLLRTRVDEDDWIPVDLPDIGTQTQIASSHLPEASTKSLLFQAALSCLSILVFGVLLVLSSETIAVETGLGASFVGVTLLAAATSLPELTTIIAAVRLGAYTMAISNIFGSNLIMLVLVFPADVFYRQGPILASASPTSLASLGFGVIVTSIFLTGLIVRRKPRVGPIGVDSLLVILVFFASLVCYYALR